MPLLHRRDGRAEFAGDEGVQGAEAGGELDDGQAAFVVEPAEEVCRRKIALLRVAFPTAGDEVAVGIILQLDQRDDMVEAAGKGSKPVQAIKATAAFSQMDGAAQSWMFQEVEFLESVAANGTQGASRNWTWGCGGNLLGQADLHHVACFAAFHEAQDTAGDEAAHGPAHGVVG